MKWKIEDWMGNRLFDRAEFDSFEEGMEFIYITDPEPEEDDPRWLDGWYDDYYVVPIPEELTDAYDDE